MASCSIDTRIQMNGYSGAEIAGVCREAALMAIERAGENVEFVTLDDFQKALARVLPRTPAQLFSIYDEFQHRRFRSSVARSTSRNESSG